MATVLEYAKRDVKPLAIEPYDREWGVGVSGLASEKSPFPRINRLAEWVRTKKSRRECKARGDRDPQLCKA